MTDGTDKKPRKPRRSRKTPVAVEQPATVTAEPVEPLDVPPTEPVEVPEPANQPNAEPVAELAKQPTAESVRTDEPAKQLKAEPSTTSDEPAKQLKAEPATASDEAAKQLKAEPVAELANKLKPEPVAELANELKPEPVRAPDEPASKTQPDMATEPVRTTATEPSTNSPRSVIPHRDPFSEPAVERPRANPEPTPARAADEPVKKPEPTRAADEPANKPEPLHTTSEPAQVKPRRNPFLPPEDDDPKKPEPVRATEPARVRVPDSTPPPPLSTLPPLSAAPPLSGAKPADTPVESPDSELEDRRSGQDRRRALRIAETEKEPVVHAVEPASSVMVDFEAATMPEPERVTAAPAPVQQQMLLDPAAAAFEAARIAGEIVGDIESASGAAIVAAAAAGAAIEATRARMAAGQTAPPESDPLAVVAAATAAVHAAHAATAAGAAADQPPTPPLVADGLTADPITTVRMQRERILRALAEDIAASPGVAAEAATQSGDATTSATQQPHARSSSQADHADDANDPVQMAAAAIQRLRTRASTDFAELRTHYHRHDVVVLVAAFLIIVIAGRAHTSMVTPPTVTFPCSLSPQTLAEKAARTLAENATRISPEQVCLASSTEAKAQRGLTFEYPRGWLKALPLSPWAPRIVRDPSGQAPKSGDAYHVAMSSSVDGSARIEILVEKKPAWNNIITGLELDRRTRWGELYTLDQSTVEPIEDQDWLRTAYRYAHAAQKGDVPSVDRAIEYATVDREQIYIVTLFGSSEALAELETVVAPSLRVAARPGTRTAQQLGSRTRTPGTRTYPGPVGTAFDSTVMIVVADLIDGRLVARGGGSGVIVGDDGSILTNYHVIRDKNGRLHDAFVIGRSDKLDRPPQLVCAGRPNRSKLQPELDLALVKCDTDLDGRTWTPASVTPSRENIWPTLGSTKPSDVKIGQRIWVLGYPDTGSGNLSLSPGSVDGWTGHDGREGRDFIKVDAALSLGNSGGPVIDDQGRLVGIASFLRTRVTGGGITTTQEKLVRPISTASDLLAIAQIGWTPRENHTTVEIEPSGVEPVVEGVRIETFVIDAANEAPIRDALVMVLKRGVNQDEIDVNRIDEQVIAWGRSNAQGEVKLNQPVPVGTYSVLVRATGYEPLIGEDKLRIDESTPPRYDPWTFIKLAR